MSIDGILIDALGRLFNGKIYTKKSKTSKELTFEKYANISISAGLFKEKPEENKENKKELSPEEEEKIYEQQKQLESYQKLIKDRIEKEKLEYKKKFEIEMQEDKTLEKELMKHQNCKEKVSFTISYKKKIEI